MKNKLDIITNQQEMLLSNTDTQIWYLTDYDKYGKVNQTHADFLGVNKQEIENEKLDKFFTDEEAKVSKRKNKIVFKGKKKIKSREWIRDKNNELRCLSITKIPKINSKGNVEFVICSANDITEKIKKKEQLKLTQFSVDNAPIGVYWITPEGKFEYVNNKACKMLNYKKEELIGKKVSDLDPNYHSKQRNQFWKRFKKINAEKLETKHKTKNGDLIPVQVINKYIKYNGSEYEFAFVQDISDRKEIEEKLKYLSFNDQLTGLYNRRYFENEMDRLDKSRKLPISIVIADIDDLKFINDNYGHTIGDEYIKKAAEIIEDNLRKEDIAARIGGDEFAIILTDTSENTAAQITDRITKSTDNIIIHNGIELNISIGFSTKNYLENSLESVFTKADKNMYKMKNNNLKKY